MPNYRRDAGFALLCGLGLLAFLGRAGAFHTLRSVPAVAVGVTGALSVEALFACDTPAGSLWERRGVRAGSALALIAGAVGLTTLVGPVVVAAACWGLVTYFALLAGALFHR